MHKKAKKKYTTHDNNKKDFTYVNIAMMMDDGYEEEEAVENHNHSDNSIKKGRIASNELSHNQGSQSNTTDNSHNKAENNNHSENYDDEKIKAKNSINSNINQIVHNGSIKC